MIENKSKIIIGLILIVIIISISTITTSKYLNSIEKAEEYNKYLINLLSQ